MYTTRSPTSLYNPYYKTLLSIIAGLQTLLNVIVWVVIPGVIYSAKISYLIHYKIGYIRY